MTDQGDNDNNQKCDDHRRVDVELLIVHPSIADSGDAAHLFRDDGALDSEMMPPA